MYYVRCHYSEPLHIGVTKQELSSLISVHHSKFDLSEVTKVLPTFISAANGVIRHFTNVEDLIEKCDNIISQPPYGKNVAPVARAAEQLIRIAIDKIKINALEHTPENEIIKFSGNVSDRKKYILAKINVLPRSEYKKFYSKKLKESTGIDVSPKDIIVLQFDLSKCVIVDGNEFDDIIKSGTFFNYAPISQTGNAHFIKGNPQNRDMSKVPENRNFKHIVKIGIKFVER